MLDSASVNSISSIPSPEQILFKFYIWIVFLDFFKYCLKRKKNPIHILYEVFEIYCMGGGMENLHKITVNV